ncbi:T9SS type A sorting domain-containing protein [Bacteroidia bacterium]|nr:T9SS type A sorting domain-containing protein [Bacteroidia bacterium]MDC1395784.1 T9SS type A sorting domain-containing protein [Bacteroidia bacterium]
MTNKKDSRRQFLKNISLAATAFTVTPLASVGASSHRQKTNSCEKTTLDYYGEGPFYTDNPPQITDGKLAAAEENGTRIRITGRVQNEDCTEFIPNTVVDIWHADAAGAYDNVGYKLRGQVFTNDQGFYMFETIKPGKYLNGSKYRPSHIHFKITPLGFPTIITQLYFNGDTSIADDAAAGITTGPYDATHRIIELVEDSDGVLEGTWDIAVNGEGLMGVQDIHLSKGIIYSANPNPFSTELKIKYGVFRKAEVAITVYNLQGKLVAKLQEQEMDSEKYEATWHPNADLPHGFYFITLHINDLQVHYLKVQYIKK